MFPAPKPKSPGHFVEATREDGSVMFGFIERIVAPTDKSNSSNSNSPHNDAKKRRQQQHDFVLDNDDDDEPVAQEQQPTENKFAASNCVAIGSQAQYVGVLPRSRRNAADRFLVRRFVGRPMAAFTDENGVTTSDLSGTSQYSVLEMPPGELFPLKAIKPLVEDDDDERPKKTNKKNQQDAAADEQQQQNNVQFNGTANEKKSYLQLKPRLASDGHFDCCCVCGGGGTLLVCDMCCLCCHMCCVAPPLQQLPRNEWRCAKCCGKPSSLSCALRFRDRVRDLVDEIAALDTESVFAMPVSSQFVLPTYAASVIFPVDLSMMRAKAESVCYRSLTELLADVDEMVDNCKSFNSAHKPIVDYAVTFQKDARSYIQKTRVELRDLDVADTYADELLSMAAAMSSETQARRIDPLSISVFSARALPYDVRQTARPPRPLILPRMKPLSSSKDQAAVQAHAAAQHFHNRMNERYNLRGGAGGAARDPQHQQQHRDDQDARAEARFVRQQQQHESHLPRNFVFRAPLRVTLVAPPSQYGPSKIVYTTDGSHPVQSASAKTQLYTGQPLLISETTTVKAVCGIGKDYDTLGGRLDDSRSFSLVCDATFRVEPLLTEEQQQQQQQQQGQHQDQQQQQQQPPMRKSALRQTTRARQQPHQAVTTTSQESTTTNRRRARVVAPGEEVPSSKAPPQPRAVTLAPFGSAAGADGGGGDAALDLPASWFRPALVDAFLERIEACGDALSSDEKRVYLKVALRLTAAGVSGVATPAGVHPEDFKRVVRDFTTFVAMNSDVFFV